ncbi:MAG: BACON domain-containing carbohydrate-binding protein, partial [Pyrinomonadaceae bacterium]
MTYMKSSTTQKSILLFTLLTLLLIFGMPFGSSTDALAAGKEVGKPDIKRTFKKKTVKKSKVRKLKKTFIESRSINPVPQIEDEFEGDKEERKNWFLSQRMYPFSELPAQARRKAWSNRPRKAAEGAAEGNSPETAALEAAATSWTPIGPAPTSSKFPNNWGITSGRINAIAVSPSDSQLILIGAATGGIWRSTDGGNTFTATSDNHVDLAVGSIAFAPSNNSIVYAGMGDKDSGYLGTGVLKSTDGGQSWTIVSNSSLPSPGSISQIEVDSDDPNRVYVAQYTGKVSGQLYSSGFWYSTDGGVNWRKTISGLTKDLVKHPTQPNTLYLSLSRVDLQTPSTGGVFKSTDRGLTWARIYSSPFATTSNIKIAVTPAASQNLYVSVGDNSTARVEISTNEGSTWTNRGAAFDSRQFYFNCYLFVHPTDPNTIFVGTRDLWRSQDGGTTYTNITNNFTISNAYSPSQSKSHPDQHHFYISPTNPNLMYLANDGGLSRSIDGAASFQSLNASLSLTMFTSLAVHPTDATKTYGGTQDNGTQRRSNAQGGWYEFMSGDGGQAVIDPLDPSIVYSTYIYRDIYRWYNNGDTSGGKIGADATFASDRTAFYPPFVSNSVDSTLYFGTYRLYISTSRGTSWTAPGLTQDLTKGGSDTLSAIGVGRSNTSVIYTGSAQGRVMVSTNAGGTWTDRTTGLPNRFIKSIIVSPTNSNIAYLTVSGFDSGHVFKTVNAGASWTDISGNLPNIPTNTLLIDPRTPTTLYVGTDIGVFRSLTDGTNWETFNSGMPPVIVSELDAQNNGLIQAATYGRGAYELSTTSNCSYLINPTSANAAATANTGSVSVTTTPDCSWTAASGAPSWLTVTGGSSGTGNGTVGYSVAANTGAQRTGTMTVAGQTFTLTQAAAGIEGDVSPRPDSDGVVQSSDVVQVRRFQNGTAT